VFERFTDGARKVVVRAQEESRLLGHSYIGTEHLLLGVVGDTGGVAEASLADFGVTAEAVRHHVVATVGRGSSAVRGHIPFTARAKKVLELSLREALQLGHTFIGTEHILLGLLREGEGVATQVLTQLGADLSAVRDGVLRRIETDGPSQTAPGSPGVVGRTQPGSPGARTPSLSTQTLLTAAAQLAGADPVASHHLLTAALSDPNGAATRALTSAGIDVSALVDALQNASVEGTSEDTPAQRGRRHTSLRVDDDAVVVRCDDPELVELAREVWSERQFGDRELSAADDEGRPVAGLLKVLEDVLHAIGTPEPKPVRLTEIVTRVTPRRRRRRGDESTSD
jgi:ATP-dependent Clp protease ATP-binding subunit ClpC